MTHHTTGRAMNGLCRRCGGFLIVEQVLDYHSPMPGMRCINCGWYRLAVQPSIGPARGARNRGTYK